MQTDQQSSTARIAAVIALATAFIVFVVIVVASFAGGDSDDPVSQNGARQGKQAGQQDGGEQRRVYVVKPGDCCLSQIAERTGVDVDELVQLNPNLDPQAIHSGDRVKLR